MELILKRIAKREKYTIGKLYINGEYLMDTIEDRDRGLHQSMSLDQIKKIKIASQTAIPAGTYIKNGFVEVRKNNPGYWYVKNKKRYHRFNYNKASIKRKLPEVYDNNKTEREMMEEAKFYRIYGMFKKCQSM